MRIFLNRIGAALEVIVAPSVSPRHTEQKQREGRTKRLIATVAACSRARFGDGVLPPLLDAGWHEGRQWDCELMEAFMPSFDREFPVVARAVLAEFGGLEIGFRNRTIVFGSIEDRLRLSLDILAGLLPARLFPLGRTNIFEDDGLAVLG